MKLAIYCSREGGGCRYALDALKRSMRGGEDVRLEYILRLQHVAVIRLHMGAMENKGLSFNDKYVLVEPETAPTDYAHVEAVSPTLLPQLTGTAHLPNWFKLCLKKASQSFATDYPTMFARGVDGISDVVGLRRQFYGRCRPPPTGSATTLSRINTLHGDR